MRIGFSSIFAPHARSRAIRALAALGCVAGLVSLAGSAQAQSIEQKRRSLGTRIQQQEGIETQIDPRAIKRIDTRLQTRLRTRIDRVYGAQTDISTSYTPKVDTQATKKQ